MSKQLINRRFARSLVGAVVGVGLWAANTAGFAQSASTSVICQPSGGYVVGYYNGTFALPEDAFAARAALRIARHGKNTTGVAETLSVNSKDETVHYEAYYSTAGSANGATLSRLQTVAQEYQSNVLSGALANYWEYFWDMLAGSTTNWAALADKSGDARFTAVTTSFPSTVKTQAAAAETALATALSTSTTLGASQFSRAQAVYIDRQKMLMVAQQGQGVLFQEKAYAKAAPATATAILKDTLTALPGSTQASMLTTRMAALETPPQSSSNQGFLTATLSWTTPAAYKDMQNDFDLHVVEPTGYHVYYDQSVDNKSGGNGDHRRGDAGLLDQDSTTNGPEHYVASCDENVLKEGIYAITATQQTVQAPDQTSVTLQVAFAKTGLAFTKTWPNAKKAKEAKSDTCPDCTEDLVGFTEVKYLAPQVRVKVTRLGAGAWKAELVN